MAKGFTVFAVTAFAAFFFAFNSTRLTPRTFAYPDGAPDGTSSAPGEVDCTDCHNQNTLTGQFQLILPASYVPGQTYQISVQHTTTDTTRKRWGFQLTSLRSGNTAAGTFADTTLNTQTSSSNGRNYVNQTSTGSFRNQTGGATWTFNWTAPATDVGAITFYSSGLQANNANGNSGDQTYTTSQSISAAAPAPDHQFLDFDGDGKSDPAVFRPSTQIWYLNQSTAGFAAVQWGLGTDILTPADFDGDNRADVAVWRPAAPEVAAFYIFESSTSTVRIELFGQTGDDPTLIGDWDGDGKADPAVYRDSAQGSQSYFYFRGSLNNPSGNITFLPWGTTGDVPVRGDFDGDGLMDVAVFRPSNNVWYIRQSSNSQINYVNWGLSTDKLVPGDYDGDGMTDPAVFRDGIWYVKRSTDGGTTYIYWGLNSDDLVPGDYDGDARTDAAVFRHTDGIWYIRKSNTGTMSAISFGTNSDRAVPAAFVK
jgi:hypothetical protein